MGKILTVDGFEITHLEGTNAFVVKGEKLTLIDKFEWQDETTDRWPIVERAQVAMDSSNYYQCENKFSGGASIPACQGSSPGLDMGYLGSLHSTTGFTNEDVSELHSCFGYMESWDYYAVFRNMEPKTISIPRIVLTGVFFIFCMWIIQLLGGIRKVLGTIGESLKSFFRMLQRKWRAMIARREQAKLLRPQQARERKIKMETEKAEKSKKLAIRKEKKAEAKKAKKAKKAEKLQQKTEKKAKDLAFYNSPMEVAKRAERRELAWRVLPCWVLYLFNYSLFLVVKAENVIKAEELAIKKAIRSEEKAKNRAIKKEKKAEAKRAKKAKTAEKL